MKIDKINIYRYANPLKQTIKMMGSNLNERQGFYIEIFSDQHRTLGDICPFPGINEETLEEIEEILPEVCKKNFTTNIDIGSSFFDFIEYPSLRFGIETALYDLQAQILGKTFPEMFSDNPSKVINICKLITLKENIEEEIKIGVTEGYKCFKIKIDSDSISETLSVIRSFNSNDIKFRLDGNRGLELDDLVNIFEPEDAECIEYIEEPFRNESSPEDLFSKFKEFYQKTGVGIALDESILEIDNLITLQNYDWLKALIIKPIGIGSLSKILEMSEFAHENDCDLILSSAFESEIGLNYLYGLVSGLKLESEQGFDTFKYLEKSESKEYPFLIQPKIDFNKLYSIEFDKYAEEIIYTNSNIKESDIAVISDKPYTYGNLWQMICKAEAVLIDNGIRTSYKVAIHLNNSIDYISFFFACQKIGAVAVLISTRLPDSQVIDLANEYQCKLIISDTVTVNRSISPRTLNSQVNNVVDFDPSFFNSIDYTQDSSIIFTSGSSGKSKGVLHTYGNHYYNALGSNCNILLNSDNRWLLSLPLYHVGGLSILFRCFLSGATVVVEDNQISLIDNINKNKITHISLVPTQLYRLLEESSGVQALKQLKYILVGGGPISQVLIDKCREHEIELHISYGSTEMASQIVTYSTSGKDYKPLKYRDITVSNNEILVRGQCLAKGYFQEGELVDFSDEDGWFRTNDLGKIDDTGKLIVIGRKDNMFISGGENIQPEEIESAIRKMSGVIEVFVVPIDDDEFGQRPIAFIESDLLIERLDTKEYLKDKIASFKIPIAIYPITSDMKSSGIKLSRRYFKEIAESTHRSL